MKGDVLAVILEGQIIGELKRLGNGALRLRYHDGYCNEEGTTPLSVSMPSTAQDHGDARITPWLWGLLPDNADVLARWARDFHVSLASPFSLLGTQVGHDCAGAVQFCHPSRAEELLARDSEIDWVTEEEVARRLRSLRVDSSSWLGPGSEGQFSLGGAQAKTALHRSEGVWGVPTGSTPTTHILKPAVAGFAEQDLNEHLCLTAARAVGIRAATTEIAYFEDERVVVVERFDRSTVKGDLVRVHQEDLCQALSQHPAKKYQADGGPSPTQIAELIRATVAGSNAPTDVWRFFDALVFNWLILGTDAHAKNYSFLLAANQVRLAPLYDIASFLPYDTSQGHKIKLAMQVGSRYNLHQTDRRTAWEHTSDDLKLDRAQATERVVDLAERVPAAFAEAAETLFGSERFSDLPARLVDLVTRRCQHCKSVVE